MKKGLHSLLHKCIFSLALVFALHAPSYSQLSAGNYFEGGFTVAPMVFLGDLGGHFGRGTTFLKDYNMKATKLSFGAFLAAHPAEWIGFRLQADIGQLEGDDAYITPKGGYETARYNRNLDFKTNIVEGFFAVELYPTVFLEDMPTELSGRLRPYALAGIGVFHFNPQGSYVDPNTGETNWVYLRPLHTEGEGFPEYPNRKEYSLTQMNVPLGVGIKYYFSETLNLSFELIYRKTFTDYLDDVSTTFIDPSLFYAHLSPGDARIADQIYNKSPYRYTDPANYGPGAKRGDVNQKDAYFSFGFKLAFRFGYGREWNNSTHCPLLRF
ncbi:MAG TPA: outer membrane beta-barrel protein [Puia sp.]|nr:outer membrane beta-barrel protein [Puia sp.]